MRRQFVWVGVLLIGLVSALATRASAAEEWCYGHYKDGELKPQYNLLQQSVIDQRALGGDLKALVTRAACSWPLDEKGKKLSPPPKPKGAQEPTPDTGNWPRPNVVIEGYFWTALAYCKAEDPKALPGGVITRAASWWGMEAQMKRLKLRFESVRSEIDQRGEDFKRLAFEEYQRRLAALGPAGLVELGRTSACAIEAGTATSGGIWLAAYQAWMGLEAQLNSMTLPGQPPTALMEAAMEAPNCQLSNSSSQGNDNTVWRWSRDGGRDVGPDAFDPRDEYCDVEHHMTAYEKERAKVLAASLLQGLSEGARKLREGAAIARVNKLDVEDIKWALYVLLNYKGAINKDYDQEAARDAQTDLSKPDPVNGPPGGWLPQGDIREPDGWLTHQEVRAVICKAAVKTSDTRAIALGLLAYMYANGIGFPEDLLRARAILNFALPQIDDLLTTPAMDPAKKAKLKGLKTVLEGVSNLIDQQIEASKLTTATAAPFKSNWGFLCPSILDPKD